MRTNFNVCDSISKCTDVRTKKIDIIKDKKAKSKVCYIIQNPRENEYEIIPFEDCVFKDIQNEVSKCDYGLKIKNNIYFIELKGGDNNKALKQIFETIQNTKNCFKNSNFYARVIATKKQPPKNLDKITEKKIKKLTNQNLLIERGSYTENI